MVQEHAMQASPVDHFMANALLGRAPAIDADLIGKVAARHLCFESPGEIHAPEPDGDEPTLLA